MKAIIKLKVNFASKNAKNSAKLFNQPDTTPSLATQFESFSAHRKKDENSIDKASLLISDRVSPFFTIPPHLVLHKFAFSSSLRLPAFSIRLNLSR